MSDDSYYVIAALINQGILLLEKEKFEPSDVEPAPEKTNSHGYLILDGVASFLLKKLGETRVQLKYKRFDVYGHDSKTRIECGHTKGGKLLGSLFQTKDSFKVSEFWIIQYRDIQKVGKYYLSKFKINSAKMEKYKDFMKKHVKKIHDYRKKFDDYPIFWIPTIGMVESPFESYGVYV